MEVADRIVVMNEGRVEQVGSPDEVYDRPATPFVLQFLGDVNLFHGRRDHAPGQPAHGVGGGGLGGEVSYVRPHEIDLVAAPEPGSWTATLAHVLTVGPNTRLELRRQGDEAPVDVELSREAWNGLRERLGLRPGSTVYLKPRRITRFDASGTNVADDPAAAI